MFRQNQDMDIKITSLYCQVYTHHVIHNLLLRLGHCGGGAAAKSRPLLHGQLETGRVGDSDNDTRLQGCWETSRQI